MVAPMGFSLLVSRPASHARGCKFKSDAGLCLSTQRRLQMHLTTVHEQTWRFLDSEWLSQSLTYSDSLVRYVWRKQVFQPSHGITVTNSWLDLTERHICE